MNRTIGQAFDAGRNNFDVIRILAALAVLVSHCYLLTGNHVEPFARYLGAYDTGGGWGVAIFFIISGFLVTRSCLVHTPMNYVLSRVLRILPALLLVSIFEYVVVGPLFTKQVLAEYFAQAKTHLLNIRLFWLELYLPGTFLDNPDNAANSSLWTLPVETACYILLPVIGMAGGLNRRVFLALTCLVAVYYAVGVTVFDWSWNNQGGFLFSGVPLYSFVKNGLFFMAGALMFLYKDEIPLNVGMALCCMLLLVISAHTTASRFAFHVAVPYLVLFAALWRPLELRFYQKLGDLSYGTYLFAFPIQQSVVAVLGPQIGPFGLIAIATPIVLCVAAASWRFVEKPCLGLRRRMTNASPGAAVSRAG